MAGSLVDLADPDASIPARLIVDSNIVIDWLLATGNLHVRPRAPRVVGPVQGTEPTRCQIALDLDAIRALVDDNGIVFLQPDDPDPIPSGRLLDDEVVRTMERYELDSGDAAILVESRRAGINAIATADADLHRAQLDFDGSTWP